MRVDVGIVCLRLGPIAERRGVARKLAAERIHRADTLMYDAKGKRAEHVHSTAVAIEHGQLVEIPDAIKKCRESRAAREAR